MKRIYQQPQCNYVFISNKDVITASPVDDSYAEDLEWGTIQNTTFVE